MEKHVINLNQSTTVAVTEGDSKWALAKGTVLTGSPAILNEGWDNVQFSIAGEIDANAGLYCLNVGSTTDSISVDIASTGRIDAEEYGVLVSGEEATITNAGRVASTYNAVVVIGNGVEIDNSGRLTSLGTTAITIVESEGFSIHNDGVVRGNPLQAAVGIESSSGEIVNVKGGLIDGKIVTNDAAGDISIINRGRLEGSGIDHISIVLGDGNDRLVNRGTIEGSLILGDGDDTADLRGGTLEYPFVFGGLGDDTFIVSNKNIMIEEMDGEGYDTIKTTVSFTLSETGNNDIEVLQAIGKKNISLTGNDETNALNGNAANNKLSGGGGIDILWGVGGNDVLTGGDDTDLFYFRAESGVDTITDFTIGLDQIRLIEISGIGDFADLIGRMTDADFNDDGVTDTIIDLGDGNRIRLAGVDKGTLDAGDFYISPVM